MRLVLLSLCAAVVAAHDYAPVVDTVQGKLKGKVVRSYTGNTIYSYIGVRFAEPPTGERRFKVGIL